MYLIMIFLNDSKAWLIINLPLDLFFSINFKLTTLKTCWLSDIQHDMNTSTGNIHKHQDCRVTEKFIYDWKMQDLFFTSVRSVATRLRILIHHLHIELQSSWWTQVLQPKTSKFFNFYLEIYKNKFKNLIPTSKFKFSFRGLPLSHLHLLI